MASKHITNSRQYESAISEYAGLQLQDNEADSERFKQVIARIDAYEAKLWCDNPFEIFDFLR